MATIKKGTYRFNDVLKEPPENLEEINIPFCIPLLPEFVGEYNEEAIGFNRISFSTSPLSPVILVDFWFDPYWSDVMLSPSAGVYDFSSHIWQKGIIWGESQTITITEDTEADDTAGTWFNDNTVELKAISGCWQLHPFDWVIPQEPFRLYEEVTFRQSKDLKEYHFIDVAVEIGENLGFGNSNLYFSIGAFKEKYNYDTYTGLIDWTRIDKISSDDWWGEFDRFRLIDFGETPQLISKKLYDIITTNANQVDWNDYYKIVKGTWKWDDELPVVGGTSWLQPIMINNEEYVAIGGIPQSDRPFGIAVVPCSVVDKKFYDDEDLYKQFLIVYIDGYGWLDGSYTLQMFIENNEVIDESLCIPSDAYQVWEFGYNGYESPMDAYIYLTENAKLTNKKFTRLYIGNSVASSGGKCFKRLTTEEPQIALAAGLYDADDNLVASWDTLTNTYGMDYRKSYTVHNYKTETTSPYYVLTNNTDLANGVKLIISEDEVPYSIGSYAFCDCALTEIVIPNNTYIIGNSAFANCKNLSSVVIPNTVDYLSDSAFSQCVSLKDVTLSNALETIDDQTFSGCTSLESITIPDSVEEISMMAFYGCTSLINITIPDSVTTLEAYAFGKCTSLTSVVIGNSVTSIEDLTFSECSNLTGELIIPDSVTSIGYAAFEYCKSLNSVVISNSVTTIGDVAFGMCTVLENITFKGTIEQWNAITLGTYWNAQVPATYVTCTDGTVTL